MLDFRVLMLGLPLATSNVNDFINVLMATI